MTAHLRANFWLLVLSVLLCSVLYPLVILGIGQTLFHDKAQGSLLDAKGQPATDVKDAVGSRLIAQPFTADWYFQPRPSAASYNAAASGPSNLAGNNYQLRDQVARRLGPIVKYAKDASDLKKQGQPVGPDVESWFQDNKYHEKPDVLKTGIVARWATLHGNSAQAWVKNDMTGSEYGPCGKYVAKWQEDHKGEIDAEIARLDAWKKDHPDKPAPDAKKEWITAYFAAVSDPTSVPKPEDIAVPFFLSFAEDHPRVFPSLVEQKTADGKSTEKVIKPVDKASDIQTDIQSWFFEMWLQDEPRDKIEPVPADMVTTSGSGLDPHITLDNARWQLKNRVAAAWAKKTGADEQKLREEIDKLLQGKSLSPLGSLVGVRLVNVLEVNLVLKDRYEKSAEAGK